MNGVLERTLGILELLSHQGESMQLATIAEQLNIPKSAVHRLLADLTRLGYVRHRRDRGDYQLSTKLVSIGLTYLSKTGIVDIAQPLINQLAEASGELTRLSVVDGEQLTWVALAQGARQGLRYDPDMGTMARLSCSSSGLAWLATMSEEDALAMVIKQGIGSPEKFGPNAPATLQAVQEAIAETRNRGYSVTIDTYSPGLSAIGAAIRLKGKPAIGALTVAGPTARFTLERMLAAAPALLDTAAQLAAISNSSPFFNFSVGENGTVHLPKKPIYAE
ncbi:IclR family transcriptional regulator [Alcaligenaceae bacterium CGII-47]|nr:IclR family transcriptional regulator [Alcaligenaceae bacterium CGII-47]